MDYDPKDLIGTDDEIKVPFLRKKQKDTLATRKRLSRFIDLISIMTVVTPCCAIGASIWLVFQSLSVESTVSEWGQGDKWSDDWSWNWAMDEVCEGSQAEELTQAYIDAHARLQIFVYKRNYFRRTLDATAIIVIDGESKPWAATFTVGGDWPSACIERIDVIQGDISDTP